MIYGYTRCSTNEERQDIDRQKRELFPLGITADKYIYWEYESGTKTDRAELQKLLDIVTTGDTIVTTEVSRLTRSTKQLCEILQIVQDKKLILNIGGSFVVDCSKGEMDPMTEGIVKMWGVFAEMGKNIISQRVKSGMKNAAAKGKKIGRPEMSADGLPDKFWKYYHMYKEKQLTVAESYEIRRNCMCCFLNLPPLGTGSLTTFPAEKRKTGDTGNDRHLLFCFNIGSAGRFSGAPEGSKGPLTKAVRCHKRRNIRHPQEYRHR